MIDLVIDSVETSKKKCVNYKTICHPLKRTPLARVNLKDPETT